MGPRHLAVLPLAMLMISPALAQQPAPQTFKQSTPLEWSVRMADAQMARRHDSMGWRPGSRGKWDYANNVFALSLLRLGQTLNDPKYHDFVEETIGSFIAPDGTIQTYKKDDYNLDNINPGKTLIALWKKDPQEKYRKAIQTLRDQLDTHPRTSDGGYWHKKIYPSQMWLDGLYMAEPFAAEYAQVFKDPAEFDEVAKQFKLIDQHTYDPKSGLFYHGWDESRAQSWADKATGHSPNFWSRSIGWLGMALVDSLDYLPADHPARPQMIDMLNRLCAGVAKHQDKESGLWWQVTDQGNRQGNYLEATGSVMFVYTITKAVNRGYVSRDLLPVAIKGYDGVVNRLIKIEPSGAVTLTQCCSVAGLSNGRDGSFEYYIKEPIVENDMKGVGPFIMAGIELQKALGEPTTRAAQ
jgi:unsaturated rhamnogalacturonyl hydrolase